MIDKLLLEHVGLPHVLVLAVHLVNFFGWMSQGGHSEQLSLFALFYQSTPSCLKVRGGWCAGGHVELLLVLDLAVHLDIFFGRQVKGIILGTWLLSF